MTETTGRLPGVRTGSPALARSAAPLVELALRLWRDWQPPIRRVEFWAVQALVLVIAGGHAYLETHFLDHGPMYVLPISLFFIPVTYAAVNFGLNGSVATAIWCAFLSVPNVVFWHTGQEQVGEVWQLACVVAIAVFVGNRVDRETRARRQAEGRERAHRASEEKYRSLLDHVADAILLLDPDGRIEEANETACLLFGCSDGSLVGMPIERLAGRRLAANLREQRSSGVVRLGPTSGTRWIEPVATRITDPAGNPRIQVVLRDVTMRYERERELEHYTRQTIVAREEERRRIARDLHDGPVQSLVSLVRQLDKVAEISAPDGQVALGDARENVERVAGELRRFSRELRPSILDDLGLVAALDAEAKDCSRRTGVAVRLVASGEPHRLPTELELAFLRIEQEALRNIERHAGASRARVRVSFRKGSTHLAIEDDGCGLADPASPSELLAQGKMGIVGMQERARAAGASLRLGKSALGGAVVELTAPA